MDFLLECIGFPPDHPHEELLARVRARGEPAAWRGRAEHHLRLALGADLELRADFDPEREIWSLLPHCRTQRRLRVAVDEIRALPESPFDALLRGWAAPPFEAESFEIATHVPASDGSTLLGFQPGTYPFATCLTDARRLPPALERGHVLAVSAAGFALDVAYLGVDDGGSDPGDVEREHGARIEPLEGPDAPGGCNEVSLRVLRVDPLVNALTGAPFERLEVDAPERSHMLFVSRWQLERDGFQAPRPGARIEGTFLFTGRIAGGLPGPWRRARATFG